MAQIISGFGLTVLITASETLPVPVPLTNFADDADAIDLPSIKIADAKMGLNGDLVKWTQAVAMGLKIACIPDSVTDDILALLFENNRAGAGKASVNDNITIVLAYPDGHTVTYLNGMITEGMPGTGVASIGRLKTKEYVFLFENKVGA